MINIKRYSKQIVLPEIGLEGQKKLLKSRVLIVGCGGLGSTVIPIIAGSGVGSLILCDDDNIQLSNLNRQIIYKECDINCQKVIKAEQFVKFFNSDIRVQSIDDNVHPRNFEEIFSKADLVVDCADRLSVKLFLHDACLTIKKPIIHSAAIGFIGQILTVPPQGQPCLRCFFEGQNMTLNLNCANSGVFGATVAVIGGIVATEVIKYFVGIVPNLIGRLQRINLKNNEFNIYKFAANRQCIACGDHIKIDPYDINNYEGELYLNNRKQKSYKEEI